MEKEILHFEDIIFKPQWEYKNEQTDFTCKSGVIPGKLFYSSIAGEAIIDDIEKISGLLFDLYQFGSFRNAKIVRIIDYSHVNIATISVRRSYAEKLNTLNHDFNCKSVNTFICGAKKITKAYLQLFSAYVKQNFFFVDTVEEAFKYLQTPASVNQNSNENFIITNEDLAELNKILGSIIWFDKNEDLENLELSENNPIKNLEDTIDVVKRDIVELRFKEEEEREQILNILLSLQVAVIIIDRDTHKIVFVNNAAAEISLTTPEKMIGRQCHNFICPKDIGDCPVCDYNKIYINEETVILRSDGSEYQVLKSVKPVIFRGKSSLLETYIDVSELVKARTESIKLNKLLQNNDERLALAMEVAKEGVWDLNIANNTLDFDSTIYKMAGYTPGEYSGLFEEWEKKVHPDYIDQARVDLEKFLSGENNSYRSEFKFLRKEGNYMWIKARGNIVEFDNSDKPIRYIGILTDITSRKMQDKRETLRNKLQSQLIKPGTIIAKSKKITNTLVSALDADFARIWLLQPGDLCENGCIYHEVDQYAEHCKKDRQCLHLIASSGRYTHIDGDHRRVPIGAFKIGSIFADKYDKIITNDVQNDQRIHDKKWAEDLGLISFAGFRLEDSNENRIGVMALFSKSIITPELETYIESIAKLTSQIIINDKAETDLKDALFQAERANNLMEGREIRIRQIKEEINVLTNKMGWGDVYSKLQLKNLENANNIISLEDSRKNALSLAEDAEIARRELVEINEQLSIIKQAVNSSSDAVAISTVHGDFFYLNSTFTQLFDYSIDQIAILDQESLFKDGKDFKNALQSACSGIPWKGQIEMVSREGIIYPIYLRSAPFKDNNKKIIGIIWDFTNITEQKKTEAKIHEYTKKIENDLAEKKIMLQKATILQKSFIQDSIPLMENLNIHALFMPCENLGGDFFRILKGVHQDKLIIIIGDCTDHGIKASMDASLLSSLIDPNLHDLYNDNRTDNFLQRISKEFMEMADEDQFPTMLVMLFDIYTGDLFYSNANSELPYLIRNNHISRLEKADGMHIGYFDNPVYERKLFRFQSGDRLFFYSDAIIELKKENHSLLGHSGMKRILNMCTDNAENSFDCLINRVKTENGNFPLDDDTTLIMVEFAGSKKLKLQFNNLEDWKKYHKEIKVDLYNFDYSIEEIEKLSIALDEMCINAFDHGNKGNINKSVNLTGYISCKEINILIEDEGEGFNPDSVPDPVLNIETMMVKDDEEEYTHGRGIWISKEFLDSVEYNKKGNSVRIIKEKSPRKVRDK